MAAVLGGYSLRPSRRFRRPPVSPNRPAEDRSVFCRSAIVPAATPSSLQGRRHARRPSSFPFAEPHAPGAPPTQPTFVPWPSSSASSAPVAATDPATAFPSPILVVPAMAGPSRPSGSTIRLSPTRRSRSPSTSRALATGSAAAPFPATPSATCSSAPACTKVSTRTRRSATAPAARTTPSVGSASWPRRPRTRRPRPLAATPVQPPKRRPRQRLAPKKAASRSLPEHDGASPAPPPAVLLHAPREDVDPHGSASRVPVAGGYRESIGGFEPDRSLSRPIAPPRPLVVLDFPTSRTPIRPARPRSL